MVILEKAIVVVINNQQLLSAYNMTGTDTLSIVFTTVL
jgi:hypothetical protein